MLKRKKSPRSTSPSSSPPHQTSILEQQANSIKSNNGKQQSNNGAITTASSENDSDQKSPKHHQQSNTNQPSNLKLKKKKSPIKTSSPSSTAPTTITNPNEINNNDTTNASPTNNEQKEYKYLEDLHLSATNKSNNINNKENIDNINQNGSNNNPQHNNMNISNNNNNNNSNNLPVKKKQKGPLFIDTEHNKEKSILASEFIPLSSTPVQIQNTQSPHQTNYTNRKSIGESMFVGGGSSSIRNERKAKSIVPPLWLLGYYNSDELSKLELEKEIVMFYDWLAPNPLENRLRQKIVDDIESIIRESWPHAEMHVFGSFSTDLCIPTSDIDIQISGINDHPNHRTNNKTFIYDPIREFYNILNRKHHNTYTNMRLIAGAKVPIIKLVHRDTWYNVDICFDTPNGIENTSIVKSFLKKYKSMKLLLLLLKFFLFQNKLNETYTGGIGSYALALMVASYIQLRYVPYQDRVVNPRRVHSRPPPKHAGDDTDYGAMLIEFFELYGRSFQYTQHAISLEHNGYYYQKEPQLGIYLTLIDPHDRHNDVGKNSFNISFIRGVFTNALVKIVSTDFVSDKYPSIIYPTLLSRVIDERQVEQISRDRNRVLKFAQHLADNNQLPLIKRGKEEEGEKQQLETPEYHHNNPSTKKTKTPNSVLVDDDNEEDEENVNNHITTRSFESISSSPSSTSDEYSDEIQFIDSSSDVHSSSSGNSSNGDDNNNHNHHNGYEGRSSDSDVSDSDEASPNKPESTTDNDKNFFGW